TNLITVLHVTLSKAFATVTRVSALRATSPCRRILVHIISIYSISIYSHSVHISADEQSSVAFSLIYNLNLFCFYLTLYCKLDLSYLRYVVSCSLSLYLLL